MPAKRLDSKAFHELMESGGVALVDFWASWCGPCRMMGPTIDDIADELDGKNTVGKVNVDDERDLASAHEVMTIPTLIFFKDGREAARMVGVQAKQRIIDQINLL